MGIARPRLLVIGLDGFDYDVATSLRATGRLPSLTRLENASRRFRLDSGIENYTGLAWEQFSSGLTAGEASRWSAVTIDTKRYVPDQPRTRLTPFVEKLDVRSVAFDVPYFDFRLTTRPRGMSAWGSHDPGVARNSVPTELSGELIRRFGDYPATNFIYGHVWHNPEKAAEMSRAMIEAVEFRSDVTSWLFGKQLPDWDLAITVISEYHSATEALWHGWEESHPLHRCVSSGAARAGLIGVYEAADRMLGRMLDEFPDAAILAFSPSGMGRNFSDVSAMLLLPELLYRHCTGKVGFTPDPSWSLDGTGSPDLIPTENWSRTVNKRLRVRPALVRRVWRRLMGPGTDLFWMPAARYHSAWPAMQAYATPAFYDGRIRINLEGRESRGVVPTSRYEQVLKEMADLVRECRDPITGDQLDVEIDLREGDPRERDMTDADLFVRFKKDYYAFRHDRLGLIGPAPCRRPGGHTGGPGMGCYLNGSGRGEDLLSLA